MLLLKKRGISILVSTAAMSLLHKKIETWGKPMPIYRRGANCYFAHTDNHNVHQWASCLTVVTLINSQDIKKEIAPCKAQTTIWGKTVFLLSQLLQKYIHIFVVFVACI